jgi:hypothetical protein
MDKTLDIAPYFHTLHTPPTHLPLPDHFDFPHQFSPNPDRLSANQAQHHRNLIRQAVMDYAHVQWVVVDHPDPLDPNLINLPNISTDTLQDVLALAPD